MNDKDRASLVDELAAAGNFHPKYGQRGRRWSVDKLIRTFEKTSPPGTPVGQIRQNVEAVLAKATAIASTEAEFNLKLGNAEPEANSRRADVSRRIEILYGAISSNPELADQEALRKFIVSRRYRSVVRMEDFVNFNLRLALRPEDRACARGYMWYRALCCPNAPTFQLNENAQPLWERSTRPLVVFRMSREADPVEATDKLWVRKDDPCRGNLLDCATAMCCVLMDSLKVAADEASLLGVMKVKSEDYLVIRNPSLGPTNFLSDGGPTGLFERVQVPPEDFQVGDYVFVWNHPVYQTLVVNAAAARGEHAIVTKCGDRQLDSARGFLFSGHGVRRATIDVIYESLHKQLQTEEFRAARNALLFLEFMRTQRGSIPADKWHLQQQTPIRLDDRGNTVEGDHYDFDVDFKSRDLEVVPTSGNPLPKTAGNKFQVDYASSLNIFLLMPERTVFKRVSVVNPGDEFNPVYWILRYDDYTTNQTDQALVPNLFQPYGSGRVRIRPTERSQMPVFPFGTLRPEEKTAIVTRPRVDVSVDYQRFLTNSGAI